jgi:O-antigen ligase
VNQIQLQKILSLKSVEYWYAAFLVFILTQGPIYKIWRTSETYTTIPITPTWQASFIIVQAPALVLLGRSLVRRDTVRRPMIPLFLFLGWMLVSATWTNLSRFVVVDSIALVITALAGLYLGSRFTLFELASIFWLGSQSGVLISYFAVKSSWTDSIDSQGNWVGIYFNRNSLAPVAMISLVSAVIIALRLWRVGSKRFHAYVFAVLVVVSSINVTVYFNSGSRTAAFSLLIATCFLVLWHQVENLIGRLKLNTSQQQALYVSSLTAYLFSVWQIFRFQDAIGSLLNTADIFNGRSAIWNFSWTGFLERPVFGWGWRAAWGTPEFLNRDLLWTTAGATWAHNGFLEILLGGGVIGLLFFLTYLISATFGIIVGNEARGESAIRLGSIVFVCAASTQESFIVGNHFLWLMLVSMLAPGCFRLMQLQLHQR